MDTYFDVPKGRMKLREGNIENHLIHYFRGDQAEPKLSDVTLFKPDEDGTLKKILLESLNVKVIVDKVREIYFIDNVKFHIDIVKDLGSFMEIEAIDEDGKRDEKSLQEQCTEFMSILCINSEDLITCSYSDLLLER